MRFSVPYAAGHTAGSSVGEAPRGLVRTTLTAGALLLLAVVVGLSLAAGAAQATTFPGTNGRIAASGALAPLGSPSRLELFTMDSSQNASATVPAPDQCRLTDNLDNSDFNPRYSKDGRKIVWVKDSTLWPMQLDQAGKCPAPSSDPTPLGKPGDPKQLTGSDADAVTGGKDSFVGGWCTKPNGEEWIVF